MNKTAVPLILSSLQPISAFKRQNQAMSFVIRSLFSGYLDHILTTGLTIIFRQTSEANCSLISFEKYSIQRTASNLFSDNDPFLTSASILCIRQYLRKAPLWSSGFARKPQYTPQGVKVSHTLFHAVASLLILSFDICGEALLSLRFSPPEDVSLWE